MGGRLNIHHNTQLKVLVELDSFKDASAIFLVCYDGGVKIAVDELLTVQKRGSLWQLKK